MTTHRSTAFVLAAFRSASLLVVLGFGVAATTRAQAPSDPTPPSDAASHKTGGKAESDDDIVTLNQLEVTANSDDGYGASTAMGVTRMNTILQDIPQSISVVSGQLLSDTASTDVNGALAYQDNVSLRKSGADPTSLIVRGFVLSSLGTYRNGFHVFGSEPVDMAAIDHIEIIKGPASAVVGHGEAAGAIDYITKTPQPGAFENADVTIGSYNFYRFVGDVNQPLNASGSLSFRAVGVYQTNDTWRIFELDRKYGFYPSLDWKLDKNTLIRFSAQWIKDRSPAEENLEYITNRYPGNPAGLPYGEWLRSYNPSQPWDARKDEGFAGYMTIIHTFNDHLSYRQGISIQHKNTHMNWEIASFNWVIDPKTGDWLQGEEYQPYVESQESWDFQGDLVAKYNVLWGKQTTLAGYEYQEGHNLQWEGAIGTYTPTDYQHPNYSLPMPAQNTVPTTPTATFNTFNETISVFVQHQAEYFDGIVKLMVGVRMDRGETITNYYDSALKPLILPMSRYFASPRYGITISPLPWLSIYMVRSLDNEIPFSVPQYSSGFPATDPRSTNVLTGATDTTLTEGGVKTTLLNGRFSATFAWFSEIKSDAVVTYQLPLQVLGPNGLVTQEVNQSILSAGLWSRGIEIELFGQITPQLDLIANYARDRITTPVVGGFQYAAGTPDNQEKMFLNYRFFNRGSNGLSIRGGVARIGPQWGGNTDPYKIGPMRKYDFGAGYAWGPKSKYKLDVELINAFNEIFVPDIQAPNTNDETPPREVMVTFHYKF